jgi:hypothetical protein
MKQVINIPPEIPTVISESYLTVDSEAFSDASNI